MYSRSHRFIPSVHMDNQLVTNQNEMFKMRISLNQMRMYLVELPSSKSNCDSDESNDNDVQMFDEEERIL